MENINEQSLEFRKAEFLKELETFKKQLEMDKFEQKFWWHGHDEESGEEEKRKYEESPEMNRLNKLRKKASELGFNGGTNIMVSEAVDDLIKVFSN